ncbi:MAG: InlB B-repeat-containing protein, partial [Oscillospiraceae bacterium]|nr:InlB B-repeat-containing protein [Oscillospiraceae bacterium]
MPTPTWIGHTFSGWYTAASGGTKVTDSDTVNITENTTLHAQWTTSTYTVTYDPNGGSVDPTSQDKFYGSTYGKASDGTTSEAMPTPTWIGHTFSGWYTAASGGTKVTDSDTVNITENTTLHAQWSVNQYTLTFGTDGGSSVSSITQDYNTEIETSPLSTKAGYIFQGWYTEEALTNKVSFPYTITASVTMYAKWMVKDSGGSTSDRTIAVTETSSGLFSGSEGQIKAEANMSSAFSDSVEVKVTDTEQDASNFGLGAGSAVYPFDISLYIKGTSTKTEPKDSCSVTISLPVPDDLLDVKEDISIVHKSDDGTVTTLKSQLEQINGVWYLVFQAEEFSPYALVVNSAGTNDESAGLPYYLDSNGKAIFIGLAANGKYIAPSGAAVFFKENTKSFTDIGSHWAKDYINFVIERELFAGTAENEFEPDIGMTRAMFATVIGRLYERSYGEITAASNNAFTDVDYDNWYGKYVDWADNNSIITGIGDGQFDPNREITRQEMAAILYRFADFLGVLPGDMETTLTYPDADTISNWAMDAAGYCQTSDVISGRTNGFFAPKETATRAEVAAIIARFVESIMA